MNVPRLPHRDKRQILSVNRDGLVTWRVNAYIISVCEIVVEFYPFDTQICSLDFTTEQSPMSQIKILNYNKVSEHKHLKKR